MESGLLRDLSRAAGRQRCEKMSSNIGAERGDEVDADMPPVIVLPASSSQPILAILYLGSIAIG
jgi:hypothetical protein